MDFTAEQFEMFPVLCGQTKPKSKFRQWLDATDKHGPLLTPVLAAAAAALSRQRIHTLINEGRLATVEVGEHRMVPVAALELFLAEDRPNGAPRKNSPSSLSQTFTAVYDRQAERLAAE